ncbi:DoxX family protein [Corynebacterium simulans]|uniref:DoxX family protein n=1 Tax=Corynebacterium simulans TaxID=146827 RepID=UPI001EF28D1D|nr:DoxX family protein [Corynebacterium simulans]MCG7248543.1 DoxX family protein [Corynebacterium simulans]
MNRPAVRDTALLLLRAVLGLVFVAHGVDKMFFAGIDETTGQFSAMGIPQPHVSAYIAALGEMIGGSLLVVGLLTTFVAGALALFMACALYFAHLGHGLFAADGGFEYPAVLIASLVMIVVFGSGRVSLDGVLSRVDA